MSGIPYHKLRTLSARKIIGALLRDGFYLAHQRGSHQQYLHSDGRRVTLTFHSLNQTFPLKTMKSMLEKQAHWSSEDLTRLGLV